jgi:hypothetical protein
MVAAGPAGKTPSRFGRPSSTGRRSSLPSSVGAASTRPPSPNMDPPAAPPTISRKRRTAPPKRFDDEENASDIKRRRKAASLSAGDNPPADRRTPLKRSGSFLTPSEQLPTSGGHSGNRGRGSRVTRDPLTSLNCGPSGPQGAGAVQQREYGVPSPRHAAGRSHGPV